MSSACRLAGTPSWIKAYPWGGNSDIVSHNSPSKNSISDRLFKNDEMQGVRILRNEAYMQYAAMTKDEAQHSRSRFSTA